jgi:hypothetical protein
MQAKLTCKSPGDKGVLVHGAKSTIKLEGKGKLIFWCNNSTLDPHGEGECESLGVRGGGGRRACLGSAPAA